MAEAWDERGNKMQLTQINHGDPAFHDAARFATDQRAEGAQENSQGQAAAPPLDR